MRNASEWRCPMDWPSFRSARRGRRGSIGIFLAGLAVVLLLTLPIGTAMVRLLDTQTWRMRSAYYLDELLPQAYFCLDPDELAVGCLVLDPMEVNAFLRNRMTETLPKPLSGRLSVQSFEVHWLSVPEDPDHWLKERQPVVIPVVRAHALVQGTFGQSVEMIRSVELIQMPE